MFFFKWSSCCCEKILNSKSLAITRKEANTMVRMPILSSCHSTWKIFKSEKNWFPETSNSKIIVQHEIFTERFCSKLKNGLNLRSQILPYSVYLAFQNQFLKIRAFEYQHTKVYSRINLAQVVKYFNKIFNLYFADGKTCILQMCFIPWSKLLK